MKPDEWEVLALGLGFCPMSKHDLFTTTKYLNLFVRKLLLKGLHHKTKDSSSGVQELMKLSSWNLPSSPSPLLEAFASSNLNSETVMSTLTELPQDESDIPLLKI